MRKSFYSFIAFIPLFIIIDLLISQGWSFYQNFKNMYYNPAYNISDKHKHTIKTILNNNSYIIHDSILGWTINPKGLSEFYKANSSGIRANRNYNLIKSLNITRISSFGDSFTHCDGVANNSTWQTVMEHLSPSLEILNFGVSGYGLDQAFLRYTTIGKQYNPHIVLICFMSENIYRHINVFRPFYQFHTGIPFTKPRFIKKENDLILLQNPFTSLDDYRKLLTEPHEMIPKIGANDYYYNNRYKIKPPKWMPDIDFTNIFFYRIRDSIIDDNIIANNTFNTHHEAYEITKRILAKFYNEVISNNAIPVIIILPNKSDIINFQKKRPKQYSGITSFLESSGYKYLDLIDTFDSEPIEKLFLDGDYHYSSYANELVGRRLATYLHHNIFPLLANPSGNVPKPVGKGPD